MNPKKHKPNQKLSYGLTWVINPTDISGRMPVLDWSSLWAISLAY